MGNKCKPLTKLDQKPGSKLTIPFISEEKKLRKTEKRWETLQMKFGPNPASILKESDPERFRRYLADGPPVTLRWEVWKVALGVKNIAGLDTSEHEDNLLIEKDLGRTFPCHGFFLRKSGKRALREVLLTMVNNHPELGYCQGMNSVAGVLLIVSEDPAESYSMLKKLCYGFGARELFEYEFPLVTELCAEFHRVLADKMRDMHKYLEEIELDDNLWLTKWFMTLFSYSFHIDCVLRIWDAIFAYGLSYMVNIALGILEYLKPVFIGKSLQDMLEYLPELREIMVDVDVVLYYSSKYTMRVNNREVKGRSFSISQEVEDLEPIVTNWEVTPSTTHNSKNILEEFSECFSSNSSKFSM